MDVILKKLKKIMNSTTFATLKMSKEMKKRVREIVQFKDNHKQ